MRRADRPSLPAHGRGCRAARHLRLRRGGAHRGTGGPVRGPAAVRFTRPSDAPAQAFARRLGCEWAGDADALPPEELDAAILFAPVGALMPAALRAIRPGGIVVCGGIHMSDIPSFPYDLLWREKRVVSVANLTRRDGLEFLALAPKVPVRTEIEVLPLVRGERGAAPAARWGAHRRRRAGAGTSACLDSSSGYALRAEETPSVSNRTISSTIGFTSTS